MTQHLFPSTLFGVGISFLVAWLILCTVILYWSMRWKRKVVDLVWEVSPDFFQLFFIGGALLAAALLMTRSIVIDPIVMTCVLLIDLVLVLTVDAFWNKQESFIGRLFG